MPPVLHPPTMRRSVKGRRRARRRLMALVAVLAAAGVLLWLILGHDDEPKRAGTVARAGLHGASVTRFEIRSKAVGSTQPVTVVMPAGAESGSPRPLLVLLHGRGQTESTWAGESMLRALASLGDRAPVVAMPYGDLDRYWHDRRDGRWGAFVMDEVIPTVRRRFPVDPKHTAVGGISMGGFGALDLARLHPGAFCAVGAHSPALWTAAGQTAPGAFDDAADFGAHDVVGAARAHARGYAQVPIWIDMGTDDPFVFADRTMVASLRASGARVTSHTWPGGHTGAYWNAHMADYLRFYAAAVARC